MQTIVELPEFIRKAQPVLELEEKASLSKADRNTLSKLTGLLLKQYGGQNE